LVNIESRNIQNNFSGYIIKENKTKSLILVDPGDYEIAARNIQMIEDVEGLSLRYIFSTHHHEKHNGQNEKFLARWPEVKIVAGSIKK